MMIRKIFYVFVIPIRNNFKFEDYLSRDIERSQLRIKLPAS